MLSAKIEEVRRRHDVVLSKVLPLAGRDTTEHIRNHPRWKELIDKRRNIEEEKEKEQQPIDEISGLTSFGPAYIPAETTVRNDYSQHFVDTKAGQLPGNAVCNPHHFSRFEEYPKLKRLIEVKSDILASISHPPVYLPVDLLHSINEPISTLESPFHLTRLLPIKFDVVIIDPPLESYEWESVPSGGKKSAQIWSWDQVAALPIPQIMAKESFIFLWVGSGSSDGLERGREVLMKWGYRRCEDIVWVQTNNDDNTNGNSFVPASSSSCFAKSSQHCLMGIRGTVRRSTDTRFVHCNIDTDVILWSGEKTLNHSNTIDSRRKPPEMMNLAENFCLGTRRLELFGGNRNLRRGWLTIGSDVGPQALEWDQAKQATNACAASAVQPLPLLYEKSVYDAHFGVDRAGCTLAERINLVPFHEEVEMLRPRSPSNTSSRLDRRGNQSLKSPIPMQHQQQQHDSAIHDLTMVMQQQGLHHHHHHHAGGAGISGLGAGGAAVVSVPSGSELLSGAQANVLMGQSSTISPSARYNMPTGLSKPKNLM